jgi:protein O-mannosyl-transferase
LLIKYKYNLLIVLTLSIIIISLGARTVVRNFDWKSYETLYTATAKTASTDPRARNNIGDVYSRRNEFDKALLEFNEALRLKPKYAGAQYNIGLL